MKAHLSQTLRLYLLVQSENLLPCCIHRLKSKVFFLIPLQLQEQLQNYFLQAIFRREFQDLYLYLNF